MASLVEAAAALSVGPERTLSAAEVASHNSEKSAWVILDPLNGDTPKVFDITAFVAEHPEVAEVLLKHAGQDVTQQFESIGLSAEARQSLQKYQIGILESTSASEAAQTELRDYVARRPLPPPEYRADEYVDDPAFVMTNSPHFKGYQTGNDMPLELQKHIAPNHHEQITKGVIRKKLAKMRHLCVEKLILPTYLDSIFPDIVRLFKIQHVMYNGGIAKVYSWKISSYLEVMDGGVPVANPNRPLLDLCTPLLDMCDALFVDWYKQQHACNKPGTPLRSEPYSAKRVMTFITRYTPNPGEEALLKHVDGAGKVDGSVVVALPMEEGEEKSWEGHGGGLRFWDGSPIPEKQQEIKYETRSGDVGFIDKAVWHQADPITKGIRWALVIFYEVK